MTSSFATKILTPPCPLFANIKDRRRAYLLDLNSSKKEQISLVRATTIVKDWEVRTTEASLL